VIINFLIFYSKAMSDKNSEKKVNPIISAIIGKPLSPLLTLLGGMVGGIEISCTYPTEYLKTVMQLDKSKNSLGLTGLAKETYARNGLLGFYKGYTALLLFSMPKTSVRFSAYEFATQNLFTKKSTLNTFMCGLFAGTSEAIFVVTPQETIKTRLIHDKLSANPKYSNVFQGAYLMAKDKGFSGLYAGVVPTILRQASNQGIRFVVFGKTKDQLQPYIKTKILLDLVAGGVAGFCSTLANNPIDVAKTRMQGSNADGSNF